MQDTQDTVDPAALAYLAETICDRILPLLIIEQDRNSNALSIGSCATAFLFTDLARATPQDASVLASLTQDIIDRLHHRLEHDQARHRYRTGRW